jgi:hypothetical protein
MVEWLFPGLRGMKAVKGRAEGRPRCGLRVNESRERSLKDGRVVEFVELTMELTSKAWRRGRDERSRAVLVWSQ